MSTAVWTAPPGLGTGQVVRLQRGGATVAVSALDAFGAAPSVYVVPVSAASGSLDDVATATFTNHPTTQAGFDVVVADLDADGADDALVLGSLVTDLLSENTSVMGMLAGPLQGALSAEDLVGAWGGGTTRSYARRLSVADVSGDGIDDLVVMIAAVDFSELNGIAVFEGPVTGLPIDGPHDYEISTDAEVGYGANFLTAQLDDDPEHELIVQAATSQEVWLTDARRADADSGRIGVLLQEGWDFAYLGRSLGSGRVVQTDLPEVWLGANGYGERAGRVDAHVVGEGLVGTWVASIESHEPHGMFGTSMCLADLNHDGHQDLVVGAPGDPYFGEPRPGRIYVFGGPVAEGEHDANEASQILQMSEAADSFGYAMACQDGQLFVTAPDDPDGKHVYVFEGMRW